MEVLRNGDENLTEMHGKYYSKNNSTVDAFMLSSLRTRLLNDYLVKVDRMSMKSSLEVRSPFLDKDLAEFAFSIHNKDKFGDGKSTKYLLKKLVERNYDPEIFTRNKRGFELPIRKWIKTDLKEQVSDLLLSQEFTNRGLFDRTYVSNLLDDHMNNKKDNTFKIWVLYCLEIWFRNNYK
jgi:asparagine synthase (glutamine-hydrolysing)